MSPAELWRPVDPNSSGWSEILSIDPLIIHVWPSVGFPLGGASVVGPLIRNVPAHFLVGLSWSAEPPGNHRPLINAALAYLRDHTRHRITFLGNTSEETRILAQAGFSAITLNHNMLVNDEVFYPVAGVTPVYDAVYNARLSAEKSPELAAGLDSVAFIYFYNSFEGTPEEFHAEHARLSAAMPRGTFLNKLTPSGCEWLLPHQINQVFAESRVGLCLSAIEGAMRASIEYLFAGLPIVSVPSLGGRDVYFNDEFCAIADPNPGAIRAAVKELIDRKIDRGYVRWKTLERIEADRQRYIRLVQALIDRGGGKLNFAERFLALTRTTNIQRWRSMAELSETVLAALAHQGRAQ